jgi:Ca2+-binding RTX toxin-like protein
MGDKGNDDVDGGTGADSIDGGVGNDDLDGGADDDDLDGGLGNDDIDGGDGDDDALGGGGNDRLNGGNGSDMLCGESGNDRIVGGTGHDSLRGGGGNDKMSGGTGNDTLEGGEGRDEMTGGAGEDHFLYTAIADSAVGSKRDVITDFDAADDTLVFQSMLQGTFQWRDTGALVAGTDSQARYAATGIVQVDVDGNGVVDMEIKLANAKPTTSLTALDFLWT